MEQFIHPTTEIDAIRELLMLAFALVARFIEIKRIKKRLKSE